MTGKSTDGASKVRTALAVLVATGTAFAVSACGGGGGFFVPSPSATAGVESTGAPTVETTAERQPTALAGQYDIEFQIVALEPDPPDPFYDSNPPRRGWRWVEATVEAHVNSSRLDLVRMPYGPSAWALTERTSFNFELLMAGEYYEGEAVSYEGCVGRFPAGTSFRCRVGFEIPASSALQDIGQARLLVDGDACVQGYQCSLEMPRNEPDAFEQGFVRTESEPYSFANGLVLMAEGVSAEGIALYLENQSGQDIGVLPLEWTLVDNEGNPYHVESGGGVDPPLFPGETRRVTVCPDPRGCSDLNRDSLLIAVRMERPNFTERPVEWVAFRVGATGAAVVEPTPVASGGLSVDDDPVRGPRNAPVTIIEFADFQCPYCARFARETLPLILNDYGDRVRFVFRDFPLTTIHADALKAAEASECADDQGAYWDYHDLLFQNQAALDVDSLKNYAASLGLDMAAFNDCLDSGRHSSEVTKDIADGQAAGVQGTPAFFVNGQLISGAQHYTVFQAAIEAALAAGGN